MSENALTIKGLKLQVRIGCTEEERLWPQFLLFDVTLRLDMSKCAQSDNLRDTIDYMAVIESIRHTCDENEWKLIEKMCSDTGLRILEEFPQLSSITIKTLKNVSELADGVECSLTVKR